LHINLIGRRDPMAVIRMKFGELKSGYFKYDGKLYYAGQHGKWTFHFPVVGGAISRRSDRSNIWPNDIVEVIPREDWPEHSLPVEWANN